MKKLLIIITIIMCLPLIVLADSAGPSILGYDAVVINKKGAKTTDGEVIKYNSQIHVYREENGKVESCYKSKNDVCDKTFKISIKDIAPIKKEISVNDLEYLNNFETSLEKVSGGVLVVNKNGIKLKKGPAEIYGKYDAVIPYKTELSFTYAIDPYRGSYSWYYIDDGKYKGWIDSGNNVVESINGSIMLFSDTKFFDIDTEELITTIPSETVINKAYGVYFTYQNKLGFIGEKDAFGVEGKQGYVFTINSAELISKGKAISAIPKGERIKILYAEEEDTYTDYPYHNSSPICINEKECYYYVEYNGTKGFVSNSNVIPLNYEEEIKNTTTDKEYELYNTDLVNKYYSKDDVLLKDIMKSCKTEQIIPVGSNITVYKSEETSDSNSYYYLELIKYNNNYGWIITEIEERENAKPTPSFTPSSNKPVIDEPKSDKPSDTIIYAIIGATLTSAAAIGTIIVINSKKKKMIKKIKWLKLTQLIKNCQKKK